ncbi:MAG: hypothetical protein L6300_02615 [Syntrophaceae bacterium]|nr:hypothetical protein [Syntrophaceae bacterium]
MAGKITFIISGLLILLVAGCATIPTQQEIANLNYGEPITIDYQSVIKDYFEKVLFDPYSAHYDFGNPRTFWMKEPPLYGGGLYAGYMVIVGVNARNRMGGYVGMQEYGFIFKDNQIIKILRPEDFRRLK